MIVLTNTPSLVNKRDDLEHFVSVHHPAVIALTETWLTKEVVDSEVSIGGYTLFLSDRSEGKRGGVVLLYVNKNVSL